MGRVYFKIQSDSLAKAIWGENANGVSWEYIYFVKEGKQIEVPFDPTVIGNKENQVIQRAYALNEASSVLLKKYLDEKCGDFVEESIVQPSSELTEKIYNRSLKLRSPEEILSEIEKLSVEAESKPVKEKVTMAKALSRNYKFARLVKERVLYICEICGSKPFIQKSGLPYAEAHHIDELAKTRIDSPNKMICVCPTCHRVLHYGDDASLAERRKMKK
jgi:predicted restriction endonuclease